MIFLLLCLSVFQQMTLRWKFQQTGVSIHNWQLWTMEQGNLQENAVFAIRLNLITKDVQAQHFMEYLAEKLEQLKDMLTLRLLGIVI